MKREFLFSCYQTPRGKLLQALEIKYLKKIINISYKQTLLQIGGLNFENEFVDFTLFQRFTILDKAGLGRNTKAKIMAKAFNLPIQSETIDMVILPHLLEFDAHRFQTMREVERVLKPEGQLIILSFNPWSFWLRTQYLWDKRLAKSWRGHFISRSRQLDWLKLLNFELKMTTEFEINSFKTKRGLFSLNKNTFLSTAYAIKAIKRRYTIIPLTQIRGAPISLTAASTLKSTQQIKKNG
ncbi:MAG: methyltransferase domain-containing protein [Methylococcales bacterium]|nr:methyltransferase domain-containing protein [Methylococcales bacterium]MCK5924716.1 methyltransferase domain-containing protein [Methylococcales bacterium]